MDSVQELIVKRLKELGETLKSGSKKLGLNDAYLQQFVKRNIPKKLPEDVRRKLAQILQVSEDSLRREPVPADGLSEEASQYRNATAGRIPVSLGGSIPLYGHAIGGSDGQFPLNGNQITTVTPPPSLLGVRGAYAVAVAGTSMEPRYFAGEAVFVNPRVPVRVGDFVVIQLAPDEEGEPPFAYVKRYLGRGERGVRFDQLNPPKKLTFPDDRIVSIHRIVMSGDA